MCCGGLHAKGSRFFYYKENALNKVGTKGEFVRAKMPALEQFGTLQLK